MIQISKAIRIIDRETAILSSERINLADAHGRVLAENVIADTDLPPFDRSQMDGYAVKAEDTKNAPVTLKIVGESAAGRGWHKTLNNGEAVRIMTGAPVPKGADAVQKIELSSEADRFAPLTEPTSKGRYIIAKGGEVRKGRIVLKKSTIISAGNISVPAAFGYAKLKVAKRPRVAIISTGTEIVEIGKKPKQDQIRNSNSLMLAALCRQAGADPTVFPIVGDDISDLRSQISNAVKSSDILITTGGVSVGKYDLTKLALEQLGAEIVFDKVALKPGKPTVFGRLKKTFVFGLPGNPVSAAVTFQLFVRRAIGKMQGLPNAGLKSGSAVAGAKVKGTKERASYLPASLSTDADGQLVATPIRWFGSSDFVGYAAADALVFVAPDTTVEAGEVVKIRFLL